MSNKKTDSELKQIASDMYEGKIFSSLNLGDKLEEALPIVFMPMMFGALSERTKERADVGLIYEYISEAAPRSINGFPVFFSLKILNDEDTRKVFVYYEEYKKLKEDFIT
jgi:hypothetical protein